MPAGGVPSWAVTSSSAAIFGGGSSTASPAPSQPAPSSLPEAQQPASQPSEPQPTTASTPAPYKHKRKRRPVTHCAPLSSVASSSRVPYSIPHVDSAGCEQALRQLIAVQATRAGFDAATLSAMHEVEQLTNRFLTSVFAAASHAAELACRDQPSARDLLYALETHGQPVRELRAFHRQQLDRADDRQAAAATARNKAAHHASHPQIHRLDSAGSRSHDDDADMLPSDSDEGSEMDAWSVSSHSDDEHPNRRAAVHARASKRKHDRARILAKKQRRLDKLAATGGADASGPGSGASARDLRALTSGEQAWRRIADHVVPRHLPGMPPRHSWMQTPAYPTNAYGASLGADDEAESVRAKDPLMLVNRKLANARLVEASLRRLIQNTDSAAAVAYAATRTSGEDAASADPAPANTDKEMAASDASGFAVPKAPASGALTLRLKNKISQPSSTLTSPSQPSTPQASRRPSAIAIATHAGTSTPTPLGMAMGWGGEPLMSPLTPVSATLGSSAAAGAMTPYPPTPGGVYGHYFGSNPGAAGAEGGGGYRSRSQSIAAGAGVDPYATAAPDAGTDKLGIRVPGPVNYKNVWYAPGSSIVGGGIGGGPGAAAATAANNHPRSVKRLRKWKV